MSRVIKAIRRHRYSVVTPELVDASLLVYRAKMCGEVIAVFDRQHPVTKQATVEGKPRIGHWTASSVPGEFRLGSVPVGPVTCHAVSVMHKKASPPAKPAKARRGKRSAPETDGKNVCFDGACEDCPMGFTDKALCDMANDPNPPGHRR